MHSQKPKTRFEKVGVCKKTWPKKSFLPIVDIHKNSRITFKGVRVFYIQVPMFWGIERAGYIEKV